MLAPVVGRRRQRRSAVTRRGLWARRRLRRRARAAGRHGGWLLDRMLPAERGWLLDRVLPAARRLLLGMLPAVRGGRPEARGARPRLWPVRQLAAGRRRVPRAARRPRPRTPSARLAN